MSLTEEEIIGYLHEVRKLGRPTHMIKSERALRIERMIEMENKIKPTRNLVLCRASGEREEKTKGGIHIPETVRGRQDRAEVLAVGEGWYTAKGVLVPCCVEPGQVVLFDPYRVVWTEGVDMQVQTKHAAPGSLFLIHDDAILAAVE